MHWVVIVAPATPAARSARAPQTFTLVCASFSDAAPCTWHFYGGFQRLSQASAADWNAAEQHFESALRQAIEFPHQLEEAEVRRFQAMMLLDRAALGDRMKARGLLSAALENYTALYAPACGVDPGTTQQCRLITGRVAQNQVPKTRIRCVIVADDLR